MFRLIRTLVFIALAFVAGVQYERADAGTACADQVDWGPYLNCVSRAILAEWVS